MNSLQCFDTVVGRHEEHLACKQLHGGCWHGYLSGVRCKYDLNVVQLMLLPPSHLCLTVSLSADIVRCIVVECRNCVYLL